MIFDFQAFFPIVWAILSILIGSVIFFQFEANRITSTYADFMDVLINIINKTKDNGDLYIFTPNANLGQTQLEIKFDEYHNALNKAINKQVNIYFYIWDFEKKDNKYYIFNLNNQDKNKYCTYSNNNSSVYNDEEFICKHLQYIQDLFDKRYKTEDEIGKAKTDVTRFLLALYDNDKVNFQSISGDKHFFLIYNGKDMHISSIDKDNKLEGSTIELQYLADLFFSMIKVKYNIIPTNPTKRKPINII